MVTLTTLLDHSTLTEVATANKATVVTAVMEDPPKIGETPTTTGASQMTGMKKSRMTITRA
jgi:hypothetical protein